MPFESGEQCVSQSTVDGTIWTMPPLAPVPNVARIDIDFGLEGDPVAGCHLFFESNGTVPTVANLDSIAAQVATAYSAHLNAHLAATRTCNEVVVTDLTSPTSARGSAAVGASGGGPSVDQVAGLAAVINYPIARRYRGGKPRGYWPLTSTLVLTTAGVWSGGSAATLTTDFQAFLAAVLASSAGSYSFLNHVNVSYFQGFTNVAYGSPTKYRRVPTPRSPGPITDVIAPGTAIVSEIPGNQRRRTRRA